MCSSDLLAKANNRAEMYFQLHQADGELRGQLEAELDRKRKRAHPIGCSNMPENSDILVGEKSHTHKIRRT